VNASEDVRDWKDEVLTIEEYEERHVEEAKP
jgi:hypothetical protein